MPEGFLRLRPAGLPDPPEGPVGVEALGVGVFDEELEPALDPEVPDFETVTGFETLAEVFSGVFFPFLTGETEAALSAAADVGFRGALFPEPTEAAFAFGEDLLVDAAGAEILDAGFVTDFAVAF